MRQINVTRSSMPSYEEYCAEIRELWDSRWLTNMGAKHEQLRTALRDYLDVPFLDLFSNGHMAIELSLQGLNLTGEVITTPFTFASTTQAIVRNGLTPVFCDIDPVTFCMDPEKIEALITPQTSAILPVHVYGTVCDTDAIGEIAARYGLKVLYDAAHCFGERYRGRGIGSFGDVSCFSFHATKVFHTIEGGAACFHDSALEERLARLKNFGITGGAGGPEDAVVPGANAKLNEFSAAMGLCNLRHIDGEIAKRKRVAERYRTRLEGVPGIRLAAAQKDVEPNYGYYPVVFEESAFGADRDAVFAALAAEGIHARKYFWPLTSSFSCLRGCFDPGNTPVAERISRRVLTLPLYAELENETVDHICEIVQNCRR